MFDEPAPEEGNPEQEYAPDVPDASAAPPELRRTFWVTVLAFNLALFGLSVGPMLIGFRGRWLVGGGLLALGGIAGVYGFRRYRRFSHNG